MARSKQRRRELARLKYQRQSVRRSAQRDRQRKLGIIGGVVVAVLGVIGLVWLIIHLANDDSPPPTTPEPTFSLAPNTLTTPTAPITLPTTNKGPTASGPSHSAPTKSGTPSQHGGPSKPSEPTKTSR